MSEIRFGVVLYSHIPLFELVRAGVLGERYNFDSIWWGDHLTDLPPAYCPDPWINLTAIGVQTKRVMLSSAVTDVQRCHPAKTAHIVATLDELTNGRAALGIGAGEAMNIVPYGIKWEIPRVRAERLKEAIQIIKLLWTSTAEKPVSHQGKHYRLKDAWIDQHPTQKPHPPVYVGALGSSRTLRIVGEVGDGWFPWFNTPETFKRRIETIKSVAKKAKRSFSEIDRVAMVPIAITKDPHLRKKAVNALKREVVVLNPRKILRELGYEVPIPRGVEYRFQRVLATQKTMKITAEAVEKIPDDIVEKFMAIGTAEECIESLEAFIKAGATHIAINDVMGPKIFHSLSRFEKTLKAFSERVIPYFKEK